MAGGYSWALLYFCFWEWYLTGLFYDRRCVVVRREEPVLNEIWGLLAALEYERLKLCERVEREWGAVIRSLRESSANGCCEAAPLI